MHKIVISFIMLVLLCVPCLAGASRDKTFEDDEHGILFPAPKGKWERVQGSNGKIVEFRNEEKGSIEVYLKAGAPKKNLMMKELAAKFSRAFFSPIKETKASGRQMFISSAETAEGENVAAIWIEFSGSSAAFYCRAPRDGYLNMFFECERMAEGTKSKFGALELHKKGREFMGENDEKALELFSRAIRTDPGYTPAYASIGRLLLRRGERAEVVAKKLEELLADVPRTEEIKNFIGELKKHGNI